MKDEKGLIDFSALNPDVTSAIGQGRKRAVGRGLSPAQRRKAQKDAARNTRKIDLPPDLETELESMAANLGVSWSGLAVWLMARGLETSTMAEIEQDRKPIRSMRYEYALPYQRKSKHKT